MIGMGVMAAGGILSSFGQARAAEEQARLQIAGFRHSELNRAKEWANQSWFQSLEQAEKWGRNRSIGEEAARIQDKTLFWDQVRHENTTSQLSRGMHQGYNTLQSQTTGRLGSNSNTSRALLRSSMSNYFEARDTLNVNKALKDKETADQYQKMLNMRDFGFTTISQLTPGVYAGQDPSSAYSNALMTGLGQTAMGMGAAGVGYAGAIKA
jgi:hypothetical protein